MHASLAGGDSRFEIERARIHLLVSDLSPLRVSFHPPLIAYFLAPTKPIRGSTWGCALVATGSTMHTRMTEATNGNIRSTEASRFDVHSGTIAGLGASRH